MRSVDARPRPRPPGDGRVLLADVAAQQVAAGRQAAGDADRREPGERADLDGLAGADEAGEQRQQGALVGADLHPGGPTELGACGPAAPRSTSSGGARALGDVRRRSPAGGGSVGRVSSHAADGTVTAMAERWRGTDAVRAGGRRRRSSSASSMRSTTAWPTTRCSLRAVPRGARPDGRPAAADAVPRPVLGRTDDVLRRARPPPAADAPHAASTSGGEERDRWLAHMTRRRRRRRRPSCDPPSPRPSATRCSATSRRPPSSCATTPGCPSPRRRR